MMRMGLKALALSEATVPIFWLEASNLGDAVALYQGDDAIDLVLLDMNLPDSQGLQSLQRFMARCPQAKVALFSGTEDSFVIKQALSLGAVGFVPKSALASATLATIEVLLLGQQGFANTLPSPLEGFGPGNLLGDVHAAKLSPTQLKVLALVLEGMSNQEIAADCNLALGTIKNMVSSIMLSMEVTSRSHLISLFR